MFTFKFPAILHCCKENIDSVYKQEQIKWIQIRAKATGILLISVIVTTILIIASAIDTAYFSVKAVANSNQVLFGSIFQFIMSIVYLGVAILLYPIPEKFNDC